VSFAALLGRRRQGTKGSKGRRYSATTLQQNYFIPLKYVLVRGWTAKLLPLVPLVPLLGADRRRPRISDRKNLERCGQSIGSS
jgi:hypothetical protein